MPILLREGFGNLTDGNHTTATRQILGEQWLTFAADFEIYDNGDGRKWIGRTSGATRPALSSLAVAAQSTLRFAFRIKQNTSYDVAYLMRFSDGANVVGVGFTTAGAIRFFRGNTSTWTTGNLIPVNTETHVEIVVVLTTDTTGSITVYINGVEAASSTGIRTADAATVDRFILGRAGEDSFIQPGMRLADFLWHTDASPIGDVGVYYKAVDGDIGTPDFTPQAAGDNEAELDEIGPDEDTTYNESAGTAGHRDQFSAPGLTGMTILEVCSLVRARKTSTGTATLLLGMKENLTEDQSAAKALSEDYLTLIEGWATNPDTLAAWSATQAANALISYEVGA